MFRKSIRYLSAAGFVLTAVWLMLASDAYAQRWDRKTIITINQPFQIPGVALPAGKYVMKLVDVAGSRTVVRFMNSEENKVYATLLGIPDYKLETPEKSEFSFYEAKPGMPRPLRAWFYPGNNYGVEFVYPKAKAVEIAEATGEHVIATPEAPVVAEPNPRELIKEPIYAIEPSGEQVDLAAVHPAAEAAAAPTPAAQPPAEPAETLPKTATPFALMGLVGVLAAGAAAVTRAVRRHI